MGTTINDPFAELDAVITFAEKISANVKCLRAQVIASKFKMALSFLLLLSLACFIQYEQVTLKNTERFYWLVAFFISLLQTTLPKGVKRT